MKPGKLNIAAVALFLACGAPAHAETVITTITTIEPLQLENANMIDMTAFDRDADNILSMKEVGEKLFEIFDRDGNMVIDNLEYAENSLLTIAPMERETLTFIDYAPTKWIDDISYTREEFMKTSQLTRFAGDLDGLSPEEFIGLSFLALDDNDDKAIDGEEWREAYAHLVKFPHEESERYNF